MDLTRRYAGWTCFFHSKTCWIWFLLAFIASMVRQCRPAGWWACWALLRFLAVSLFLQSSSLAFVMIRNVAWMGQVSIWAEKEKIPVDVVSSYAHVSQIFLSTLRLYVSRNEFKVDTLIQKSMEMSRSARVTPFKRLHAVFFLLIPYHRNYSTNRNYLNCLDTTRSEDRHRLIIIIQK